MELLNVVDDVGARLCAAGERPDEAYALLKRIRPVGVLEMSGWFHRAAMFAALANRPDEMHQYISRITQLALKSAEARDYQKRNHMRLHTLLAGFDEKMTLERHVAVANENDNCDLLAALNIDAMILCSGDSASSGSSTSPQFCPTTKLFRLPLAPAKGHAAALEVALLRGWRRVLVVDDNPSEIDASHKFLTSKNAVGAQTVQRVGHSSFLADQSAYLRTIRTIRTTLPQARPAVVATLNGSEYAGSTSARMDSYMAACREAVHADAAFAAFKRDGRYRAVLEHVTPEQGGDYLVEIGRNAPDMLQSHVFDRFLTNDSIGSPLTHWFAAIQGFASPTTLRYVKVASDLERLFGRARLRNATVVEIGVGYGGQAKVLCDWFQHLRQVHLVDLPVVCQLADKYATRFPVLKRVAQTCDTTALADPAHASTVALEKALNDGDGGLVLGMSNYALTECDEAVRTAYVRRIVSRCRYGYITVNSLHGKVADSFRAVLESSLPRCVVFRIAEAPITSHENHILVWRPRAEPEPPLISLCQIGQELFVTRILGTSSLVAFDEKPSSLSSSSSEQRRFFLDVGANDPHRLSNNYCLELLGWRGLLLDIDRSLEPTYRAHRSNPFVACDVTAVDWAELFNKYNAPNVIDYLSLDVDEATLATLTRLPLNRWRFRVLTVEHDRYRFGDARASGIREILERYGYKIVVRDIALHGNPFEDWWYHPDLLSSRSLAAIEALAAASASATTKSLLGLPGHLDEPTLARILDSKPTLTATAKAPTTTTTTTTSQQHRTSPEADAASQQITVQDAKGGTDQKTESDVVGLDGTGVLFVIGSTLVPDPTKPLSYTSVRSIYSPDERLAQTLHTVATIRERLPKAYILISDNSKSMPDWYLEKMRAVANDVVRSYEPSTTDSPAKGLGEAAALLRGIEQAHKNGVRYALFFKLSGRYWLTTRFDLRRFSNHQDKMCFWHPAGNDDVVSTVLYSVPRTMMDAFCGLLRRVDESMSMEHHMRRMTKPWAQYVSPLGAAGRIAVDGALVDN
jgi:hypothetical protein